MTDEARSSAGDRHERACDKGDVHELLENLFATAASEADYRMLEQLLRDNPDLRSSYIRQAFIHAMLIWIHGRANWLDSKCIDPIYLAEQLSLLDQASGKGGNAEITGGGVQRLTQEEMDQLSRLLGIKQPRRRFRLAGSLMAVAACGAVAAMLAFFSARPNQVAQLPAEVATLPSAVEVAPMVGVLDSQVDATWADGVVRERGLALHTGRYELESGYVRLVYDNGAVIIVEGPATFRLDSPEHLSLDRGKVVGSCPTEDSQGFTVQTPAFSIVDLGTEFGAGVSDDGTSHVHVFDGSVQVARVSRPGELAIDTAIAKGGSLSFDAETDEAELGKADELAFVRADEFEARQGAGEGDPFDRWQLQSYNLRRDPSLVLYYDFGDESMAAGVLKNLATATQGRFDGAIQQATWAEGRFSEKRALEFVVDESQRIENAQYVEVKGSTGEPFNFSERSFSVAVSFRFRSELPFSAEERVVEEQYMPLLSKGYGSWRLQWHTLSRALVWDVNDVPEDRSRNRLSSERWQEDHDWHLVVAVVRWDAAGRVPRHHLYFDGVLVDSEQWEQGEITPNSESVTIGTNAARQNAVFDGLVDEIAIFDRAISDDEAKSLHDLSFTTPESPL